MKVILLCGGLGTRLREETEYRPKPMVPIGGQPIIWHIMKTYAHHGFKDFVVQRLRRDIAWMREGQKQDHNQTKADFYRFFSEHDRRRKTDFLATFPTMHQWWKECEYHAKNT